MNVKGKKILIIGTGKSGLAAARLLLAVKAGFRCCLTE